MILGKVIGNLVATIKKPELEKYKLFIVEPLYRGTAGGEGSSFVAVDLVGAGIGDRVVVLQGSQVQNAVAERTPVDAAIIGIVESINLEEKNK